MSDAVPTTTMTRPAPSAGRRRSIQQVMLLAGTGLGVAIGGGLAAAILFRARRYLDADMQKIMLAVLTALQEERGRAQERRPEPRVVPQVHSK